VEVEEELAGRAGCRLKTTKATQSSHRKNDIAVMNQAARLSTINAELSFEEAVRALRILDWVIQVEL